ncbi:MAG: BspA family leucine-rich repeat surface protein [Clostridia bacterium]|nr:BspA family leucine-rich repeat surface protein [Clostridia bacterium]
MLTVCITTSYGKYVLEKEVTLNLQIVESNEWNKRTLVDGETLNGILLSTGATRVVFGNEQDYISQLENIESLAVAIENTSKGFATTDIKLYVAQNSDEVKTAYILSNYQIKANENSSKMFSNYENLTEIVFSNFETYEMKNASDMFSNCVNLKELDLYKFDTSNVLDISNMFSGNNNLEKVYVSELWNLSNISQPQDNVFLNCTKLTGENNTIYSEEHVSSEYARIDSAELPGYFTFKSINTSEELVLDEIETGMDLIQSTEDNLNEGNNLLETEKNETDEVEYNIGIGSNTEVEEQPKEDKQEENDDTQEFVEQTEKQEIINETVEETEKLINEENTVNIYSE